MLNAIVAFLRWPLRIIIEQPLRHLYLHGPRWGQYGFWQGASESDICADLTGVDATFWILHSDECTRRIDRQFGAITVLAYFIIYMWIAYKLMFLLAQLMGNKILRRRTTK